MTLEGSEAECQDCRVRELPKALVGLSCGADSLPLQGLSLNCSEMVDTQGLIVDGYPLGENGKLRTSEFTQISHGRHLGGITLRCGSCPLRVAGCLAASQAIPAGR